MQTFLPFPDFEQSARCLDSKRLGKQRVETLQLLQALHRKQCNLSEKVAWSNHPAAKMWQGHEQALIAYGVSVCDEWISRGYKDTCRAKILAFVGEFEPSSDPLFLGDDEFHLSHQSNLLRKDFNHYVAYFEGFTDAGLPYVWPHEQEEKRLVLSA